MKNYRTKIFKILAMMVISLSSFNSYALLKEELKIEPGIYVLVSFSMNNQSLRNYFDEANIYGAKLVIRGLVGEFNEDNKFQKTKEKIEEARINVDINPNLFEAFNVKQVPQIVVANKKGQIKKITGHISIKVALEKMGFDPAHLRREIEKNK